MFRAFIAFAAFAAGGVLCAHPEIEPALTRLNAQIAASPDDAELYLQRGELYARHEEWLIAEANYLRATELAPHHPRLIRAQAALELATGRPVDARVRLDVALARNPRDPEALVLRARAHAVLNARARALADFAAAFALLESPPPELFLERAALLEPAEAIRSLDDAIARIGPAVTLHLRALALEESFGRIDDAAARLDRLAAQSERPEAWLKRRGDLLARAGRRDAARAAYEAALAAITALPDWLRASPDTTRLAAELTALTRSRS